ncbi:MAG: FAD-dependent oxidoreductase [Deltaproteobacteria bacterium]|nr:FAD-dependent oxidoreductase [Deltaproteobacteria bacterium]MBW2049626.1 FAD-dependent oxidoreductase [Deltaproteobacteria bacterium]MBW2110216.1 FAD-dependent oxidoreductase [Deltaproteobacteria bacterium]MBW2352946.1 FAD-dependent oxidoreductase [Deltaproteobacteria bacterium]
MDYLFSRFTLKNCDLKNRIVMPGLASFLIKSDGSITDKTVEHYRLRAAGGPAMVIMEACAVSPEGIVSPHQARIYHDRFMEGLARIARAIKSGGAVPALQIHHGGRQTSSRIIKQLPLAPSPLPCPTIRGEVKPLSEAEIGELVKKFGDAAVRAVEAGFELIEIHGAHGYLVNQFLSRFSNIRKDRYGGSTEGRARFAREIVEEVRRRVGQAYPISFKISAMEFVKDGLDVEESIEIVRILMEAGIDVVQVSAGNDATPEWICQPMFMGKACLADYAAEIRKALDLPVMAVGRINDPLVAEDIIRAGKADLVCIGRGLLADPEFPKKAMEGRLDDIRTCIACNTCMESIFKRGRVECLVNPVLGREKEMAFHPAKTPKKVMVIGAGPGGLNAAWVAARRGHHVHLFEREGQAGGQLIVGSVTAFKKELRNLIRFQKRQIERFGVKCHFNREVTADTVRAQDPDVVILATGSLPSFPPVEGIKNDIVISVKEAMDSGQPRIARTVVVVGGGPTGCEVALHLSENGNRVVILEMLPRVGISLESITRRILLRKLTENEVDIRTESKLIRVEDNGVAVATQGSPEVFIEASTVVLAVGSVPDDALFGQIRSLGYEVHRIGDCKEPRSAKAAIYEGGVLSRSI